MPTVFWDSDNDTHTTSAPHGIPSAHPMSVAKYVEEICMTDRYWFDTYGYKSIQFRKGVKAGVLGYSIWKDGERVVGVLQRPIGEVFREIDEQLTDPNPPTRLPRKVTGGN